MKKQIDLVIGTRYTRKSDLEQFVLVARWPVLLKQLSNHQPRSTTTGRLDAEYDEVQAAPESTASSASGTAGTLPTVGAAATSALDTSTADVHDGGLCPIVGSDIGWVTLVDLHDGTTETVCPGRCGAWILQDNVTGTIIERQR